MNILQLREAAVKNPILQQIYPEIDTVGGEMATILNFPTTPPRYEMAREFGKADVFKHNEARHQLNKLMETKTLDEITVEEWDTIGQLDRLPAFEPIPPDVITRLQPHNYSDTVFEENFVKTVGVILEGAAAQDNIGGGVNAYTLLEGPAGAAKSKSAAFSAAVLKRPLYTVHCVNQSPDAVKAEMTGGIDIVSNPSTTAAELARMGGLSRPAARREYIAALEEFTRHEAISEEKWTEIAHKEGLRATTPYKKPGMAELAMRYGGVLNFEEINTLNSDSLSILNAVLDVYKARHPNFYVVASMNPSGGDYANRSALPPDIRNRLSNKHTLTDPSIKSLQQITAGLLFGDKPKVTVKVQGQIETRVIGADSYGLEVPQKTPKQLEMEQRGQTALASLTPKAKETLTLNLVNLFDTIQQRLCDDLDPRQSAAKDTSDINTISLRNIASLPTYVNAALSAEYAGYRKAKVWNIMEAAEAKEYGKEEIVSSLSHAINKVFKQPFIFQAKTSNLTKMKGGSTLETTLTDTYLDEIIKAHKLDTSNLSVYIETAMGLAARKKQLQELCKETNLKITNPALVDKILQETKRPCVQYTDSAKRQQIAVPGEIDMSGGSLTAIINEKTPPMDMAALAALKPVFMDFLLEKGYKGVYAVPFRMEDKSEGTYLIIPKAIAVKNSIKSDFKVFIVRPDEKLKVGEVTESADKTELRVHPTMPLKELVRSKLVRSPKNLDAPVDDELKNVETFIVPLYMLPTQVQEKAVTR